MELPWGLLIVLIGIVWGLAATGPERRLRLLLDAAVIGAILGLVFAVLGHAVNRNPLGVGDTWWTSVLAFLILSVLFAVGVWIGDLIKASARRETA